jgi:2-isopropylmalate synthase
MLKQIDTYNWNQDDIPSKRIIIADETLRDGLQSGAIKQKPNIQQMQEFLHCASDLGIDEINIGFPASSKVTYQLAKYISANIPNISIYCTGRAIIDDIKHILKLRDDTGVNLFAALFIGTSPIRTRIEDWNLDNQVRQVREAVSFAKNNNLEIMLVTEDTTRTPPKILSEIYQAAINEGASKICIADTVGESTPNGVKNIVSYIRNEIVGNKNIQIEWHGHNDRGLAISNALQAVLSGVDRVSITTLGIGERSGNVSTHEFIYNLYLLGLLSNTRIDLSKIIQYSQCAAKMCGIKIPSNEPIIGEDIFTTESGIHASAIRKSKSINDKNCVYSSVNAGIIGRKQKIVIGPNSGKSNVLSVLIENNIDETSITEEQIQKILLLAKNLNRQLNLEEVLSQL